MVAILAAISSTNQAFVYISYHKGYYSHKGHQGYYTNDRHTRHGNVETGNTGNTVESGNTANTLQMKCVPGEVHMSPTRCIKSVKEAISVIDHP
jgi:hypothetical protein